MEIKLTGVLSRPEAALTLGVWPGRAAMRTTALPAT